VQPQAHAAVVVHDSAGQGEEQDGGEEEKLITHSWNCNIPVAASIQLQFQPVSG